MKMDGTKGKSANNGWLVIQNSWAMHEKNVLFSTEEAWR